MQVIHIKSFKCMDPPGLYMLSATYYGIAIVFYRNHAWITHGLFMLFCLPKADG
jgi:hypothetical protein